MDYLTEPYALKISFPIKSEKPSRVFRSMADMIDTFERTDRDLLYTFGARIETVLLLDDVQVSSLKSILRAVLKNVDDEALKDGDWKKAVGRFLLKGKYRLLEFLSESNEITDRQQMVRLENDLTKLAAETDIKRIPSYSPIPTHMLLRDIADVTAAMSSLTSDDNIVYTAEKQQITINKKFVFNQQAVEALLTKETKTSTDEVTVQVKKPDYLGISMWDIRLGGHVVPAKIDDRVWLEKFQNRVERVSPGDGLSVTLETKIGLGYHGEHVAIHYRVLKVHHIVPMPPYEKQLNF